MKYLDVPSKQILIILFLLSFAIYGIAQDDGSLDPEFGTNGKVMTNLNVVASIYGTAIQPDGKIVAVGTTFDQGNALLVGMVARFNQDGTLDTTFDGNGFNNNNNFLRGLGEVKILPNGKILTGGFASSGNRTVFCIARFNSDGSLDTTFDGDGIVLTTVGNISTLTSLNVLSNGKIIAVGWAAIGSDSSRDFAMVKYNADGSLDTTFGSGGRVTTNLGSIELAYDSAIQTDGKIVVVGSYLDPLPNKTLALIVRYNADGSIDTSFGSGGSVLRSEATHANGTGIAIQSNGKIVMVGDGIPPLRYNSSGTFDLAFDSLGVLGRTITVQSDGKMLVGGGQDGGTGVSNFALVRYDINDTPDNNFGTNGKITTDFSGSTAIITISIAPNGKIVAGGNTGGNTLLLAKYLNNLTNQSGKFDFDGDRRTDISIFRPSVGEWWYLSSSDGANIALQFGQSTDKIVPEDFTGDRKTDIAIWRESSGEWFILRSEDSSFYSFPFGTLGDGQVAADFDGDGKADPTIFRSSNSTWYTLNSTGGTSIRQFGINGDLPVVGDYDGDGKADLAIFRPSNGQWWINRSASQTNVVYSFGTSTDKLVPADYTGDGKTDVAFFRPSSGEWFILRSEDASFYSFPFGTSGDIPAAGDYDGDGKTDAAVFRNSDMTWYLLQSTSGFSAVGYGLWGDKPVPSAYIR